MPCGDLVAVAVDPLRLRLEATLAAHLPAPVVAAAGALVPAAAIVAVGVLLAGAARARTAPPDTPRAGPLGGPEVWSEFARRNLGGRTSPDYPWGARKVVH